ncbi:hypothetical protein [Campylobacter sp.]|nr:hypothetical protein [Campylobacter sp.]
MLPRLVGNSRIRKSSLVRCWAVQAKIFKKHSQERALHLQKG